MGLVSGKVIIVLLVLFVALGWSAATGFVKFKRDDYRCVFGKHWEASGDRQVLWSVGALHFYYQPVYWGCPETDRYDPLKYKNQDGLLTPVNQSSSGL